MLACWTLFPDNGWADWKVNRIQPRLLANNLQTPVVFWSVQLSAIIQAKRNPEQGIWWSQWFTGPPVLLVCSFAVLWSSFSASFCTTRRRWCRWNTNTANHCTTTQANKPLLRHPALSRRDLISVHQFSRLTTPVLVFFAFSPTKYLVLSRVSFFSLFCQQHSSNISKNILTLRKRPHDAPSPISHDHTNMTPVVTWIKETSWAFEPDYKMEFKGKKVLCMLLQRHKGDQENPAQRTTGTLTVTCTDTTQRNPTSSYVATRGERFQIMEELMDRMQSPLDGWYIRFVTRGLLIDENDGMREYLHSLLPQLQVSRDNNSDYEGDDESGWFNQW